MRVVRSITAHAAGIALLATALAIAFPERYLGYDSAWSAVWAGELLDGRTPSFDGTARAPTPHPLLNAIALALRAVLGRDTGTDVLAWLGVVGLAASAWLAAVLARRLLGTPAAVVVAALLLTRPFLVLELGYATHDLPFLALVLAAGLAAFGGPRRRPMAVLAALGLAGLLRPEAWPIAVAAALWLRRAEPRRRAALLLAGAAAAPVLWLLQDLLVTGDPLHSLHGTRDLAGDLGRPSGASTVPALPRGVGTILEPVVAWAALGALGVAVAVRLRALAPVVAAGALAAATFLALGAAGLPALPRYLTVPACALALTLAAVAAPGAARTWSRRTAAAAAVLLGSAVLASVPSTLDGLRDARDETQGRAAAFAHLHDLVREPAVRAAAARCRVVTVPASRALPHAAAWLDVDPALVVTEPSGRGPGLVLLVEDVAQAEGLSARSASIGAAVATPPPGARRLAATGGWAAYATC